MTDLNADELRLAEHVRRTRPRLTLALESFADAGCDPDAAPALLGMAHLGAAIILLERCDPELAQAILVAVEGVNAGALAGGATCLAYSSR